MSTPSSPSATRPGGRRHEALHEDATPTAPPTSPDDQREPATAGQIHRGTRRAGLAGGFRRQRPRGAYRWPDRAGDRGQPRGAGGLVRGRSLGQRPGRLGVSRLGVTGVAAVVVGGHAFISPTTEIGVPAPVDHPCCSPPEPGSITRGPRDTRRPRPLRQRRGPSGVGAGARGLSLCPMLVTGGRRSAGPAGVAAPRASTPEHGHPGGGRHRWPARPSCGTGVPGRQGGTCGRAGRGASP